MIKVIIKENKLITEDYTYPDSDKSVDTIRNKLINSFKVNKNSSFNINIPLINFIQDLDRNKYKKMGLPFFYYANVEGKKISDIKELNNYDSPDYQNAFRNKKIPVNVNLFFDKSIGADPAETQIVTYTDDSIGLIINFYGRALKNFLNPYSDKSFDMLIAHELTHFKQKIDAHVLNYGQAINKEKNFNKMINLPISKNGKPIAKPSGIGKKSVKVDTKTPSEEYAATPEEYIPNYNQITRKLFINVKDNSEDFKNSLYDVSIHPSVLAGKYVNLFSDPEYVKSVSDNRLLNDFLRINFLARPKEFPADLLKTLTDKIVAFRKINLPKK